MMENTCLNDFKNNLDAYITDVVVDGDILHVSTDKGAFVMMEEAEYNILREAMGAILKIRQ